MLTAPKIRAHRFVTEFPVFYGWVVVGVATLGLILPFFGYHTTVGLFIDDFITDFGLDRTSISGLLGLGGFLAGLTLPWVGKLIDRYGNRVTGLVAGALFAASLIGLSLAGSPLVFFVMYIAMRGFGVGPLSIAHSTILAQWFRSRRGLVVGITVVVTWLFQAIYIPWLQGFLETYSWRQAWQIIGLVVGLVVVPLIWLLMRDRPENFGLLPDGVPPDQSSAGLAAEDNWTLAEAQRTVIFWIFAVGRFLTPAIGSALILHQVSIFGELGYEPQVAAQTFGMMSVVAAASSLFMGVMVDRVRPGLVMVVQLGATVLTMLLAMMMTAPWLLVVYALAFGVNIALGGVFDNSVWANLFGREHLGEIRGFSGTMMSIGAAVGPILFGWSFDALGSYNVMFLIFIALSVVQMVLAWFAPRPRRKI